MNELRLCEIRAEAAEAAENRMIIRGTPIVYDTPAVINDPAGRYTEIIRRGALDGADLTGARLLYNHDLNRVPLARAPRTMTLEATAAGLSVTAELPDTETAREVYTAIRRGDLSGMSFAFTVPPGGDSYDPATQTRTISQISKVFEVSIVPFPAYPQTSVEARAAMSRNERKDGASSLKTRIKEPNP